jgi:hypothetical protein
MPDLFVEAFDKDFGTADDYLGNAFTDDDGKFEIKFEEKTFKASYDPLERDPDIYLVISDEYRIIHKTDVHSESKELEVFNEVIADTRPFEDPYASGMQRMIALFGSIGETLDPAKVDPQRTTAQLLRTISSWLHYSDPNIARIYGYSGPQVIRHPKEFPDHSHVVAWEKTGG